MVESRQEVIEIQDCEYSTFQGFFLNSRLPLTLFRISEISLL